MRRPLSVWLAGSIALMVLIGIKGCLYYESDDGEGTSSWFTSTISGQVTGAPDLDISFPNGAEVFLTGQEEYSTQTDQEGSDPGTS
jgi:hypothetical protein